MHLHHTTNEIPYGYCHCGCGQLTPISDKTDLAKGYVKGEPMQYIARHSARGRVKFETLADAFWNYCKRGAPNECWEWTGTTAGFGHGKFRFRDQQLKAHRISWILHNGLIPPDLNVLHKCDNPPCCNPRHLFLGTNADNHADMDDKGRGVTHLKTDDIVAIRERAANGEPHAFVAKEFGVNRTTIWRIATRKGWKRVP